MRTYAALVVILCLGLPIFPSTQTTTRSAATKTSSGAATKKKPARKASSRSKRSGTTTVRTSAKKKTGTRAGRSRTRKQSWRTGQMAPTPERYREIQRALIAKGYLQGEPSGAWGPDCTEALKNYQRNQNLEPSGKLDSLTLISLGLGPRREPLGSTAGMNKTPPAAEGKEPQ